MDTDKENTQVHANQFCVKRCEVRNRRSAIDCRGVASSVPRFLLFAECEFRSRSVVHTRQWHNTNKLLAIVCITNYYPHKYTPIYVSISMRTSLSDVPILSILSLLLSI